ncbi:TetR/AcrR family transcriptional regulator C-terminal domain-containing protein [Eubacterium ruminantium]|uniref:TetR/AcrR family transcriptional regulator C-terminal domain-containing protein n=1 Tax=Eubacterium ruminantium TaxID=42322 RepID=UPI0015689A7A|nr:TetR family transcriptional regulator [Eubacterium ruminantium]
MADSNITKNALADSLKNLMQVKSFDKISISDICESCGMNRKSFYYHFCDKYDLLNWIFDIGFMENVNINYDDNTDEDIVDKLWRVMSEMAEYFYTEKEFYRKALMIEGQNSFKEHFHDAIYPVTKYFMEAIEDGNDDLFTALLCDLSISALVRWLQMDELIPPDEFVSSFRNHLIKISRVIIRP